MQEPRDPLKLFQVDALQEDDGSWTAVMPNLAGAEAVGADEAEARQRALDLGHRLIAERIEALRKSIVPLFSVEPPDDLDGLDVAEVLAADALKLSRAHKAAMESGGLFCWLYERHEWAIGIVGAAAAELEYVFDDPDNAPKDDEIEDAARVFIAAARAAVDFSLEGDEKMRSFLSRVYAAGPDRQPKKPDTTEAAKALEAAPDVAAVAADAAAIATGGG